MIFPSYVLFLHFLPFSPSDTTCVFGSLSIIFIPLSRTEQNHTPCPICHHILHKLFFISLFYAFVRACDDRAASAARKYLTLTHVATVFSLTY